MKSNNLKKLIQKNYNNQRIFNNNSNNKVNFMKVHFKNHKIIKILVKV